MPVPAGPTVTPTASPAAPAVRPAASAPTTARQGTPKPTTAPASQPPPVGIHGPFHVNPDPNHGVGGEASSPTGPPMSYSAPLDVTLEPSQHPNNEFPTCQEVRENPCIGDTPAPS
ncbi:hypothetical protein [Frankia nepalensis]|uniref:Uncharacterized protein n=1 Tax=Frankia nepalensis TaxID=1836974 RepID=A0A937RHM1_9ACTN|nr:hypothetical protein [Frankia nepalensis]MBL7495305.1 hypothetical protein [Frankia nepalensis]MBL7515916.1 hypothetical protein [Frankia nepalensis]MBL7628999.1 hypothetical protein [Frankia nepalensis]